MEKTYITLLGYTKNRKLEIRDSQYTYRKGFNWKEKQLFINSRPVQ